jgi:Fe2+ transport system protein FeoA
MNDADEKHTSAETLDSLKVGEHARIVELTHGFVQAERDRLMDLGLTPGTKITAEFRSIGGDPTAYRVRQTLVALRKNQAEMILIEKVAS